MPSSRSLTLRVASATVIIASTTLISGAGCVRHLLKRGNGTSDAAPKTVATPLVKAGPTAPKIDYAALRPNELGRIPVLMYHEVLPNPGKKPLSRSSADFQQDLQMLYDAGFRPVNLSDVVNNTIDVPAGKSPVVLTFDDARASQFKLIETPQSMQIDPTSAMGILDAFHKAHPDWPMRATFFVLPKSKATLEPFGQAGMGGQKMNYIVTNGMEIGNHTTLHKNMRDMTPDQIQQEIGNANNELMAEVPTMKIQTMAVPMGKFPHNKAYWKYLMEGTYGGQPYSYKAVMDAAWQPMPAPDSKRYNANRLDRIDATQLGANGWRDWISKLTNGTMQRYVSDGDPNVISFPRGEESELNATKIKAEGKLANAYSPFGGPGGSKPIVGGGIAPAGTAPGAAPAAEGMKPIVGADAASPAAPVAGTPAPAGATAAPGAGVGVGVTEVPTAASPSAPPAAVPAAPAVVKPITGK